jgi:KipI family sensor histidine kinase inhibitor
MTILASALRIRPCGDAALTVEFGDSVDPDLNAAVLGLDRAVAGAKLAGVTDTIPTYRALFVQYDPVAIGYGELAAALRKLAADAKPQAASGRVWHIPVVYGGEMGFDLDDVAAAHGIAADEVAKRHAGADYRIYMIGFTPGFAYLGGLDQRIATPRRAAPRAVTPPGAIMIGGVQACVQCQAAPSGWHVLGRTPMRNFHPARTPMFLMEPGDGVRFFDIAKSEWAALERAAERGEPVARLVAA